MKASIMMVIDDKHALICNFEVNSYCTEADSAVCKLMNAVGKFELWEVIHGYPPRTAKVQQRSVLDAYIRLAEDTLKRANQSKGFDERFTTAVPFHHAQAYCGRKKDTQLFLENVIQPMREHRIEWDGEHGV